MKRFLTVLAVCGLVGSLYAAGLLQPVENRLLEERFRLHQRPASGEVVVVAIDPGSLRALEVWPWPRGYHATVLENLLAAGAGTVAFDLDFSSRSHPDEDTALAGALALAGPRAVLPAFVQWDQTLSADAPLAETLPLASFRDSVTLASINVRPDADGLVRRYWRDGWIAGERLPSLANALARAEGMPDRPFFVDFSIAPESIPRISYRDILAGTFDPAEVRERAILVGATTVELGDTVAVPVHAALPGVLLQALAFETLKQDRALQPVHPAIPLVATFVVCLLAAPLLMGSAWRVGLSVLLLLGGGALATSVWLQGQFAVIAHVSPLAIALVGCFAAGLAQRIDQQGLRLLVQALALRRKDVLIEQVMQSSFDAIFTLDEANRVRTANDAAGNLFRAPAEKLKGVSFDTLVENTPGENGLSTAHRLDGTALQVEAILSEMLVAGQRLRLALVRDVTEREEQQKALQHQARHDALTDLPNRILLEERMGEALECAQRESTQLSFLILDLDRFKEVNDTLGHHAGDLLLNKIARRLMQTLRPTDTIARIGGDEFAVLLPDSDLEGACLVAQRMRSALERPFRLESLMLDIGASVGISLFPIHGREATELLQHADVAMYVAKRERTGYAIYEPRKDSHSVRNLTLMADLRQAIENDDLALFYQPKLSGSTGRVVGMEALVRWDHPRHGRLSPDEFVPLAETTGLIRPLSHWVLNAALRQCNRWRRAGHVHPISVNLSVHNLKERDLPWTLGALLERWRLPPDCLYFEITESVIMEDPERALNVVSSLSEMGFGISIDDFGTGYSSLSYLRRLPARELKIDRSFVTEMDRNPGDAVIVRSIIEMAHNLGMEVVAEGIETAVVWQQIRSLGCDYGQGHLFSRPQPAEEIQAWLEAVEHQPSVVTDSPAGKAKPDAIEPQPARPRADISATTELEVAERGAANPEAAEPEATEPEVTSTAST